MFPETWKSVACNANLTELLTHSRLPLSNDSNLTSSHFDKIGEFRKRLDWALASDRPKFVSFSQAQN